MRSVTVWQISRINLLFKIEKESSKESIKIYKVLKSIMLSNCCDPVTPVILEDDFAKLMGGQIPYFKFGFSFPHDFVAAWFECFWIGGEVVIVPVLTQRLKEVAPQTYIEWKFDLPVNCCDKDVGVLDDSTDSGGWREVGAEMGVSSNNQEHSDEDAWSKQGREKLLSRQASGLI